MGELNWFQKLLNWAKEEANWDALGERFLNKETLIAVFVGGSSLGLWKFAPDKFASIAGAAVGLWSIYKTLRSQKRAEKILIEKAKLTEPETGSLP